MSGTIWDLSEKHLSQAQAKITYLGPQTKPVPTVIFAVEGHKPALVRFLSVQQSGKAYGNDSLPNLQTIHVPTQIFRNIVAAVRPVVSGVTSASGDLPLLSFAVTAGAGDALIGQEFLIHQPSARQFYAAVLSAIPATEAESRKVLETQQINSGSR